MIHRRHFATLPAALLAGITLPPRTADADPAPGAAGAASFAQRLRACEAASGGRLGLSVLDTGSGRRAGHRQDERFPLCSTFKLLAAACVLARVDAGREQRDRRIVFTRRDLVSYSPATEHAVGRPGLTMAQLCEAAVTLSDNTAANLMLASFGGPAGLTRYLRAIGDPVTRLDRNEPGLNEATPGDARDTTTPAAMAASMQKILLGGAPSAGSSARLRQWLEASRTGVERLRAGLPSDWIVGDKTGSGRRGSTNDVAIVQPPGRAPILVAAYLTDSSAEPAVRNAALAEAARAVAAWA